MTISKLYQRAHALRMDDKTMGCEKSPPEFYVGVALAECIVDSSIVLTRAIQIRMVTMPLRDLADRPAALRRTLLGRLRWPEDVVAVWESLLRTYGERPRLLLAIADGMEA